MRGVILTGVWGAGKTTVHGSVLRRLAAADCQHVVAIPQAATITTHTYAPGDAAAHVSAILQWLENLTGHLEDTDARFAASTLPMHRFAPQWTPTALLEGLTFDLPVYRLPTPLDRVRDLEARLADVGLTVALLRVPDDLVEEQCVRSTRVHRGPRWARYVESFGVNDGARAAHVRHVQDMLVEHAEQSPLPVKMLDTSDRAWDRLADDITAVVLG